MIFAGMTRLSSECIGLGLRFFSSAARVFFLVVFVVRINDPLNQWVAYYVTVIKAGDADAFDAVEHFQTVFQARIHTSRQVDLGDVAGDHSVFYGAPGEFLELRHHATSRDAFALGALRAARFAASAEAGLYDMGDVLGL